MPFHQKHPQHDGPDTNEISNPPINSLDLDVQPFSTPGHVRDVEKQANGDRIVADKVSAFKGLGWLDRFLALWILLAMIIGVLLGNFVPNTGPALQKGKFVGVSVPIAIGLLVMMYPILCKVKYETLHHVFRHRELWIQIAFSVFMNWIVAPFLMLGLAWAFLPDKSGLREGLILVGVARCIAMVLIWTGLAGGDSEYCAILVAVNSILQMVLFAPIALLFIKVISRAGPGVTVSYTTVATSVAVFLGIPLVAAILTRFTLRKLVSPAWYNDVLLKWVAPWSLIGLLFTILVLFASQGRQVVHQIVSVVRVAAPLLVYFGVIFFLTLLITHKLGFGYKLAATQSFTAASNNFELAIAVAVATFGADSDQALAATVGPLIEVPVLLALVRVQDAITTTTNFLLYNKAKDGSSTTQSQRQAESPWNGIEKSTVLSLHCRDNLSTYVAFQHACLSDVRGSFQYGGSAETYRVSNTSCTEPPDYVVTNSIFSKRRKTAPLSRLEWLPTEIIQTIFFYSLNIDLPRSSYRIAAQLSSQYVYSRLLVRALYDPPNDHDDAIAELRVTTPDPRSKELREADATLQTRLFTCRWMTWFTLRNFLQQAYTWHIRLCTHPEKHYRDTEKMEMSGVDTNLKDQYYCYSSAFFGFLRIHRGLSLPNKLLHGPWSKDKLSLLNFLQDRGFIVDWKNTSSGEIATQGLLEAIRENNEHAVISLVSDGIGVAITSQVLRVAVMECGCNQDIVWDLMFMGRLEMDFSDRQLWTWAEHAKEQGDENGPWLMQRLQELPVKNWSRMPKKEPGP
ncbi:arsenicals resistance [Cryomyces antarcticus]|nr:arsenicals resistance [Cryomyces antarcticus]